jgi:hypothetical protein
MNRIEIYPTRYGAHGTYELRRYTALDRYIIIATDLTLVQARALAAR